MLDVMRTIIKVAEKYMTENKTGLDDSTLKDRLDIIAQGAYLIHSNTAFIRFTDTDKSIEEMDEGETHYYHDFGYNAMKEKFYISLNRGVFNDWVDETIMKKLVGESSFEYYLNSICDIMLKNDDEPVCITVIDSWTNEVISGYWHR